VNAFGGPFAVSTHELARRPGESRHLNTTVLAPQDLGSDIIAVPLDGPIELDLLLESVLEGVLVTGRVRTMARGACVRCLEDVELPLDLSIQELFAYPERMEAARESGAEDAEERMLIGETADIEPTVRDAIVLGLPFQPVCAEDCPGLCPTCGERLDSDPGHRHEVRDPRWSALAALTEREEKS
jgi:uncharacterized protein